MADEQRPKQASTVKVHSPCPACGGEVPEDSVWVLRGRFFCSEGCARSKLRGEP